VIETWLGLYSTTLRKARRTLRIHTNLDLRMVRTATLAPQGLIVKQRLSNTA
jgi:hypothetical protein